MLTLALIIAALLVLALTGYWMVQPFGILQQLHVQAMLGLLGTIMKALAEATE